MAVKTITIDMAAYAVLSAEKRANESFSKVIKRRLRPEHTARALLSTLSDCTVSDEALDHMADIVLSRDASLAESPTLDEE